MFKKITLILVILILLVGGAAAVVYYWQQSQLKKVDSFVSCAAAGYPILESNPEQCRTPDGRNFVRDSDKLIPPTYCEQKCGDNICQEIVCEAEGCPCAETPENCPQDCPGNAAGLANPASINCEKLGGKVDIRSDAQGNQTGYCVFTNKQECEEWALLRNECSLGQSSQMGVLEGKVSIGPICPVEQANSPCPVPVEAYTSREIIVFKADQQTQVAHQNFTVQGTYHFELPPGVYFVDVPRAGGLGSSKNLPQTVFVKSGETTKLDITIDTGIR